MYTLLTVAIRSKPAGSPLSTFPASWVPVIPSNRETRGTCRGNKRPMPIQGTQKEVSFPEPRFLFHVEGWQLGKETSWMGDTKQGLSPSSCNHVFIRPRLLSTYCVPVTVLAIDDTAVNKRNIHPGPHGASIPAGKNRTISVINKCVV